MAKDNITACVISSYAYIDKHINYGALLQYYALEKALNKEGIAAYWLRYCIQEEYSIKNRLKKVLKKCLAFRVQKCVDKTLVEFKDFLNKYCNLSTEIYMLENELESNLPQADVYITGSDQVWGGVLMPNYLCFVPDRKVKCSYAASFGKAKIENKHKNTIVPWVKRLDLVSVREYSAIDICRDMGVEATQVLDPTLLIDAEAYPVDKIENSTEVFCYFLNISSNAQVYWDCVKTWAKDFGLSLGVACTETTYKYFTEDEQQFLGPKKWLSRYANSKYILTNTFHGTVFAIIFNKPFLVFEQSGKSGKQNERIYSLLNCFNLKDRIYNPDGDLNIQMDKEINWSKVNRKIAEERVESFKFIRKVRNCCESKG